MFDVDEHKLERFKVRTVYVGGIVKEEPNKVKCIWIEANNFF